MPELIKIRNKKTGEIVQLQKKEEEIPFLPRAKEVSRRIKSREDLLGQVPEDIKKFMETDKPRTFEEFARSQINPIEVKGAKIALKTVGGLFQRAFSTLANVGLEAQKGKIKTIPGKALKGATGEELGALSDIFRTTGFGGPLNEFLSVATGFLAEVGVSNLASGGIITKGASKMRKAIKGVQKGIQTKKRFFFADKADELTSGVDEVMTGLKSEFDNLYNIKGLGNVKITQTDDLLQVQDVVQGLKNSPTTLNKIKKTLKITGKIGQQESKIPNNINTVKTIKTEIGKSVPREVWNKMRSPTQIEGQLIDDYHSLADVIARNAGEFSDDLLALNAKAKGLYRSESIIKGFTKTGKGVTKTGIRKISDESQQGTLRELEKFSEFFPKTLDIIKDIDRFNRRQKIQKALLIGIPAAAATGFATSKIRKGLQETGGGGGGGQQGGGNF